MKESIVIGSRNSKLALIQAEWVLNKLKEANPGLKISLTKIKTSGDRDGATPLVRLAGQGVFVKELEVALFKDEIDLAVHSLKDMPVEISRDFSLAAVTPRVDPRDVLVSRAGKLAELASGSIIGTGSPRRAVQLFAYRPDLKVHEIRGNIDTRLRKVFNGEFDGVILAAAALIRSGWETKITEYLPVDYFVPAVGQGALGVEIRSEDRGVGILVSPLNHKPTWQSVIAERAFLQALGGGCHTPLTAFGSVSGSTLKLIGMVANDSGNRILRCSEEGSALSPEQVGIKLAQKMIDMGASQILEVKAG
ncbi:MAG: hydroxymethylbilane synthase [Dehalococcoidia bacterium]|nr:hydroxymethylbilane synthase [Dehalococcoidia bacterium]